MARSATLITVGIIAVSLALVGSFTSISVVRAGGAEGAVYLTVDVTLAVLGIALLSVGWHRRRFLRSAPPSSRRR